MAHPDKTVAAQWINDHLDLYNFAVSIDDTAWQQEILLTLSDSGRHIREEAAKHAQSELWQLFDSINHKMLKLYEQLRKSDHSEPAKRRLMEKMWEFKLQRVQISRQLQAQFSDFHAEQRR